MVKRDDLWLATTYVSKFHFLNPRPTEIIIEDIARSLSRLCRFGGHGERFYSVGEHSMWMKVCLDRKRATAKQRLAALLHDAEEAYLPDIPRPVKAMMPEAKKIYSALSQAILKKFEVDDAEWAEIFELDDRACATEAEQLGLDLSDYWETPPEPLDITIMCWPPGYVEKHFLKTFFSLYKEMLNG
jgi:hypothetical protein